MEACGIDVFATVRNNGLEIHILREKGEIQNHFGLLMVDGEDKQMEKKIVQVQERTPQLLRQLLKVWESGCFSTVLKLITFRNSL